MAGDNKEQESKYSTDTLYVLLLVICGLIVIIGGAYAWFRPKNVSDKVIVKDIQITVPQDEISPTIEDPSKSLDDSYLREEEKEEEKAETIEEEPKIVTEEIKEETPIFKNKTTLKKTPKKTTIVKKAAPAKRKLVTITGYWIQVGSFKTSAKAQATVDALKEKGLSSRVVLKNIDGDNWYRVRIGIYENKEEAQKFCNEVKKIKLNGQEIFKGSYVSETSTKKYIDIK